MKRTLLSLAVIAVMALASCGGSSPEANAEKFLKAYYTFDIDGAMEVSSAETKDFMNMIKGMIASSPIPDTMMATFKKTKIEIHKKDIVITADTLATVPYTLTMPAEAQIAPLDKTLKMVKRDGKWLAQYTMVDAMAENQQAQGEIQNSQENLEGESKTLDAADSLMEKNSASPEASAPAPASDAAPAPAETK